VVNAVCVVAGASLNVDGCNVCCGGRCECERDVVACVLFAMCDGCDVAEMVVDDDGVVVLCVTVYVVWAMCCVRDDDDDDDDATMADDSA
jgi:hypothetical protein